MKKKDIIILEDMGPKTNILAYEYLRQESLPQLVVVLVFVCFLFLREEKIILRDLVLKTRIFS